MTEMYSDNYFLHALKQYELLPMSKNKMPGVDSQSEREIFGQNFREARMRVGLSQRDVHRLTGVAQSHISEIETGVSNISIDTMVKLATTVKRPLWKLFKPTSGKAG